MKTIRKWLTESAECDTSTPHVNVGGVPEAPTHIKIGGHLYAWADAPAELLDEKFDDSWGTAEARPFVAWSERWVYFPVTYDGAEWVSKVPRNPCSEFAPGHVGGG
jgi:hypothetical protein